MPTNRDPQVKRNLQATADLLDALQENPTLLNDEEFMRRLSILREKHEETTNYLAKKIGAQPLPTVITSSKTTETTKTSSKVHMTSSTSCHQRIMEEFPRRLDLKPHPEIVKYERLVDGISRRLDSEPEGMRNEQEDYHVLEREEFRERASTGGFQRPDRDAGSNRVRQVHPYYEGVPVRVHTSPPKIRSHQGSYHEEQVPRDPPKAQQIPVRVHTSPPKVRPYQGPHHEEDRQIPRVHTSPPKIIRVPIRIAPAPPSQQLAHHPSSRHTESSSRHRHHSASRLHRGAPASTVRQILADATSKHFPTASVAMASGLLQSSSNTKHIPRHPPQFAASSDVVEESFLEDGMSTTREVPTIVDEMVVERKSPKKGNGKMNGSATLNQKSRSKSMHNMAEQPQVTIPKPFQLSLRTTIGNTYAKKFMSDMMSEKQKREEEENRKLLENPGFKAKPVPKSTYQPTNTFATEQKYIEAMRKKVTAVAKKKFDAQNEMIRSKSEGNLASIKPLGYVPPSTYISPIPIKPNARNRSAVTRSAILIQEATTPKGIKSHRNQSNLTHNLRHGRCKLDTTAVVQHRRTSPPDFNKIHAKFDEEYRRINSKPSTVPMPFNFAKRSQSATSRHTNCKEKDPEPFKPKPQEPAKASQAPVPSTQATRLREELIRTRLQKEKAENAEKNSVWADDNRRRIASFLGSRSKTDENIAILTRKRKEQQRETEQEYLRQLTEMKQRVLNGPLIMEKQTALAQEHRLKRKFEQRMKSANAAASKTSQKVQDSRRGSETSGAGTFIVEKDEYEEDFDSKVESSESSESSSSESSKASSPGKKSSGGSSDSRKSTSKSSSSEEASSEEEEDDDESPR